MASAGKSSVPAVERFKYSQRVVLRSILNRDDRGEGLSGHRLFAGGWVKSRKERPEEVHDRSAAAAVPPQAEDVSCWEAILQQLPLLRPFARILLDRLGAARAAAATDAKANVGPVTVLLRINDGSCSSNLQVFYSPPSSISSIFSTMEMANNSLHLFKVAMDSSMSLLCQAIHVGACILVEGVLQRAPAPTSHAVVELKVEKLLHIGAADSQKYPLAKPKFSLEFLRTFPHLRPRSVTVSHTDCIHLANNLLVLWL